MGQLFNIDNGFFRAISKIVDFFTLSVLFVLTCIPIFTIGASLSALYYAVNKNIRKNQGYPSGMYWRSFKQNFKQATGMWLIMAVIMIITYIDFEIVRNMANEGGGSIYGLAMVFFILAGAAELAWCAYSFSYLARFENPTKTILRNGALLAFINLPKTILILILAAATIFICSVMPVLLVVVPAVYTFLISLIMEGIFRKLMTDEDRAMEDENNRDYANGI